MGAVSQFRATPNSQGMQGPEWIMRTGYCTPPKRTSRRWDRQKVFGGHSPRPLACGPASVQRGGDMDGASALCSFD